MSGFGPSSVFNPFFLEPNRLKLLLFCCKLSSSLLFQELSEFFFFFRFWFEINKNWKFARFFSRPNFFSHIVHRHFHCLYNDHFFLVVEKCIKKEREKNIQLTPILKGSSTGRKFFFVFVFLPYTILESEALHAWISMYSTMCWIHWNCQPPKKKHQPIWSVQLNERKKKQLV